MGGVDTDMLLGSHFHHGYTQSARRELLYNQLDRWSLRAASKVITVSVPFREELTRRGVRRENIEIVQNAIAPDRCKQARSNERYYGKDSEFRQMLR